MKIYDKIFFLKSDLNFPKEILKKTPKKIAADKAFIRKIIKSIFEKDPQSIEILTPSSLNRVYQFEVDSKVYIFKISLVNKKYPFISFKKDLVLQELLIKNHLPFPRIVASEDDFQIMEKASGRSFHELFAAYKLTKEHLVKFGELVGEMHKIKGNSINWQNLFQINLDEHLRQSLALGFLDDIRYKRVLKYFNGFKPVLKKPSLLHGDLANHNVFTDGQEITALIDWEDSFYGDPVYDLAFYASGIYQKNMNQWLNFFDGYQSVQKLDKDFENKFWGYFLRVSLIKGTVRSKFENVNNQKLPDVKQRILFALENAEKYE